MEGQGLISRLMEERIILGGQEMSRAEAYHSLIADGLSPRCADYFAFQKREIALAKIEGKA